MPPANRLYYGDNLDILRRHDYFPNECVDLIYLDPPFNADGVVRGVGGETRA